MGSGQEDKKMKCNGINIAIILISLAMLTACGKTSAESSTAMETTGDAAATVSTTEAGSSESEETVDRNDIYLTLVNPTHKVPDDWLDKIELVEAENSFGEKYLVEKETLAHFEDLRDELLEEGIDIEIDSAYRSVEERS